MLVWSGIDHIKKIKVNENIRSLNIGETDIKRITDLERFPLFRGVKSKWNFSRQRLRGLDTLHNLKQLFISCYSG